MFDEGINFFHEEIDIEEEFENLGIIGENLVPEEGIETWDFYQRLKDKFSWILEEVQKPRTIMVICFICCIISYYIEDLPDILKSIIVEFDTIEIQKHGKDFKCLCAIMSEKIPKLTSMDPEILRLLCHCWTFKD